MDSSKSASAPEASSVSSLNLGSQHFLIRLVAVAVVAVVGAVLYNSNKEWASGVKQPKWSLHNHVSLAMVLWVAFLVAFAVVWHKVCEALAGNQNAVMMVNVLAAVVLIALVAFFVVLLNNHNVCWAKWAMTLVAVASLALAGVLYQKGQQKMALVMLVLSVLPIYCAAGWWASDKKCHGSSSSSYDDSSSYGASSSYAPAATSGYGAKPATSGYGAGAASGYGVKPAATSSYGAKPSAPESTY